MTDIYSKYNGSRDVQLKVKSRYIDKSLVNTTFDFEIKNTDENWEKYKDCVSEAEKEFPKITTVKLYKICG